MLSTYFDLARMRRLGNKLSAGRQFDIVHCRTILSALIGQEMARRLGAKLIFDMRGFWADERVEGSLWNLSNPIYRRLFAYFKRKERQFFREADLVITLTARAKEFIKSPDYGPGDVAEIAVVPCCVDTDHFSPEGRRPRDGVAVPAEAGARQRHVRTHVRGLSRDAVHADGDDAVLHRHTA